MALEWTAEKVAQLGTDEVKNLAANADDRGNVELAALCRASLLARAVKPARSRELKATVRSAKSAHARKLEQRAAQDLVQLAQSLAMSYDLTKEKARALSSGTAGFKPHGLTDSKGNAKVGGAQKSGIVVFDRYLSYRLGDQVVALLALLQVGEDAQVQYQVVGPPTLLSDAVPISELRPFLESDASIGLIKFAEEFSDFMVAADRFTFAIDHVAPKR